MRKHAFLKSIFGLTGIDKEIHFEYLQELVTHLTDILKQQVDKGDDVYIINYALTCTLWITMLKGIRFNVFSFHSFLSPDDQHKSRTFGFSTRIVSTFKILPRKMSHFWRTRDRIKGWLQLKHVPIEIIMILVSVMF